MIASAPFQTKSFFPQGSGVKSRSVNGVLCVMATIGVSKVQRMYQMSQIRFIWLLPNGISNTFSSHAAFSEQTNFKGPCRTVRNPQPHPSVILLVTALFYHNSRSVSLSVSHPPLLPTLTLSPRDWETEEALGLHSTPLRLCECIHLDLACLKIISQNNFSFLAFEAVDREDSPHPVNL